MVKTNAPIRRLIALSTALALASSASALWAAEEPRQVPATSAGTPEQTVQAALVAATTEDEAKAFEAYLALMHGTRTASKHAVEQLRRYSWKRFRMQAPDYVLAGTAGGFELARMDPRTVETSTRFVRMFINPVNNPRRTMPTPIRLERSGERWLITSNSL